MRAHFLDGPLAGAEQQVRDDVDYIEVFQGMGAASLSAATSWPEMPGKITYYRCGDGADNVVFFRCNNMPGEAVLHGHDRRYWGRRDYDELVLTDADRELLKGMLITPTG